MNLYKRNELLDFYLTLGNLMSLFKLLLFFLNFILIEHVFQETSLSVLSTADLLRERLAFITGGTCHQSPILTFPDNPQIELTQDKYKKLVSYLTQVPR
jgi:hypothetical protein